ncbi:sterol desaturase family protein [Cohnella silvisoli]|uniref:Sterol desaturase family protein n=1 Tax=Cohnella silvisoli TaxID=2873699 RepID=A0ABV1KMX3_9BACL|nr:sterol desaturase family protein [Cohnella silvisoli]MCD9020231.1 sterol desaturase family protein [Cohnella silvisoli]
MSKYLKEFWFDKRILFLACASIFYAAIVIGTPYSKWMWTALVGGIALFFVAEYFIHRFALHGFISSVMPNAHKGHEEHHNHPNNNEFLLTPNAYNVPVHFALSVLFIILFQSYHLGFAVMLGFGAYQLFYEWTHFVSHRPIIPWTPWGKWMKKHHLLHHYKDEAHYFGVTHPAFDMLLGTDHSLVNVDGKKKAEL